MNGDHYLIMIFLSKIHPFFLINLSEVFLTLLQIMIFLKICSLQLLIQIMLNHLVLQKALYQSKTEMKKFIKSQTVKSRRLLVTMVSAKQLPVKMEYVKRQSKIWMKLLKVWQEINFNQVKKLPLKSVVLRDKCKILSITSTKIWIIIFKTLKSTCHKFLTLLLLSQTWFLVQIQIPIII